MKTLIAIAVLAVAASALLAFNEFTPPHVIQTTQITVTYWRGKKMTIRRLSVRGLETYYWPEGP